MNNLQATATTAIDKEILDYANASAELKKLTSQYEVYLTHLESTDPVFKELRSKVESYTQAQATLKRSIDSYVRESRVSIKSHGVSVNFSDPQTISYDLPKLLELYPEAEDIPRLISKSVDVEMMEAAVAADLVPSEVAAKCKIETPKYKAGRVVVKVLKET